MPSSNALLLSAVIIGLILAVAALRAPPERAGTLPQQAMLPAARVSLAAASEADSFTRFVRANDAAVAAPANSKLIEYAARLNHPASAERERAVAALSDIGGRAALPWLVRALADNDASVREAALDAVSELDGAAVTAALGDALTDPDPRLRESAADALAEVDGDLAIILLQRSLSDPVHYVRIAATQALDEIEQRRQARRPGR